MGTTKHCYIQNIEALGLLVSEKKIFLVFPIVSLWRLSTPGAWPNLTPKAWLAQFMQRTISHCHLQNIKAVCPVVSEKKIFEFFSHSKSIETINLRGLAKFDPRGMNGIIYVEAISHCYIPNNKAVGLVVLEKKIF